VPIDQAKPDPSAEWWTISEVAAYLGLRVATVSSYRIRGQMPEPDVTLGRTHAWRPSKIIAWHEKRPRPGTGGRPAVGHDTVSAGEDDDQTELNPARAIALLEKACVRVGLDPEGSRLLRIGSNAVYRLVAPWSSGYPAAGPHSIKRDGQSPSHVGWNLSAFPRSGP
jgi:hypothetical protein